MRIFEGIIVYTKLPLELFSITWAKKRHSAVLSQSLLLRLIKRLCTNHQS